MLGFVLGIYSIGLFEKSLVCNFIFNMDYIVKVGKCFNCNFSGILLVGFNYNYCKFIIDGSEIINFI